MNITYPELKINAANSLEKSGLPAREKNLRFDVAVVGGGMAGICAAVASARGGAKTVLIQDRSVLGGNASSEIRVCICGARYRFDRDDAIERETGIIEEILLENRRLNPQDSYSVWDHILYDFVTREPNLELMLNTQAIGALTEGDRITAVQCRQASTETVFSVCAEIFIDCSGDGLMAAAAGAEYRTGREAAAEFDESFAVKTADGWQMGASLMLITRDMGRPCPYTPPAFSLKFDADKFNRQIGKLKEGYWWIELGSSGDIVAEQETNRHKLMAYLHGVWDYIKNSGRFPEAENLALDWVGSVPGRRESRRFMGDYILSQKDLVENRYFPDAVAYGGWPIDEHAPGGIENPDEPATRFHHHFDRVYQIPFRALCSRNIGNLMLAGRNISQTHIALASTRVMATGALMGQAVGTAGALCVKHGVTPRRLGEEYLGELQQQLISDDMYIPQHPATGENDLARSAVLSASSTFSGNVALLTDGVSRDENGVCHHWESDGLPAELKLEWDHEVKISHLELKFDTNLRRALWKVMKMRDLSEKPYRSDEVPPELVREIAVEVFADGVWKPVAAVQDIRARLLKLDFAEVGVKALRVIFKATYGHANARVFEIRCR